MAEQECRGDTTASPLMPPTGKTLLCAQGPANAQPQALQSLPRAFLPPYGQRGEYTGRASAWAGLLPSWSEGCWCIGLPSVPPPLPAISFHTANLS